MRRAAACGARVARGRPRAPPPRRPVRPRRRTRTRARLRAATVAGAVGRPRRRAAAAGSRCSPPARSCSAPWRRRAPRRARRRGAGGGERPALGGAGEPARAGPGAREPRVRARAARPASARWPWSGCASRAHRAAGRPGAARRPAARGRAAATGRVPADARVAWPPVGAVIAVSGRVAPLGRYDDYQRRRGAHAAIEVDRWRATGSFRGGLPGALDAVRRRAEAGLDRGLAPPEGALLRGHGARPGRAARPRRSGRTSSGPGSRICWR